MCFIMLVKKKTTNKQTIQLILNSSGLNNKKKRNVVNLNYSIMRIKFKTLKKKYICINDLI